MAERFDFDITPKAWAALVVTPPASSLLTGAWDPGSNGYTLNATATSPKRHRHKQIEVGDSITMDWDFSLEPSGLADITTASFTWRFYDHFGDDRILYAEAGFNEPLASTTLLTIHISGISTTERKGTDNMDKIRNGGHVFDVTYTEAGVSEPVHRTIVQGRWSARGGDTG